MNLFFSEIRSNGRGGHLSLNSLESQGKQVTAAILIPIVDILKP